MIKRELQGLSQDCRNFHQYFQNIKIDKLFMLAHNTVYQEIFMSMKDYSLLHTYIDCIQCPVVTEQSMYRLCFTFAKTFLVYTVNIEYSINIKSTCDFAQFYRFSITGNSISPVKLKCTLIDESKNLIFLV